MDESLVVRRETHIAAPPATVFAFLTDPEKILRWMGTEATAETQPGGLYLVKGIGGRNARGAFREVVPVHRLAYSFGWEGDRGRSAGIEPDRDRPDRPGWRHIAAHDADRAARCGTMRFPRAGLGPLLRQAVGRRRRPRSGPRSRRPSPIRGGMTEAQPQTAGNATATARLTTAASIASDGGKRPFETTHWTTAIAPNSGRSPTARQIDPKPSPRVANTKILATYNSAGKIRTFERVSAARRAKPIERRAAR